jgi:SNF2 family DNA or RNA helicase
VRLKNRAFQLYVMSYTSLVTRQRSKDSSILQIEYNADEIIARVKGSDIYQVKIKYSPEKVKSSNCSCPFSGGPVCKHVVHVLKTADAQIDSKGEEGLISDQKKSTKTNSLKSIAEGGHASEYVLENFSFAQLTNTFILKHSLERANDGKRGFLDLHPLHIELNAGSFSDTYSFYRSEVVYARWKKKDLILTCKCSVKKRKMCDHLVQLLYNLKDREEIRVFFDAELRREKLLESAREYGLENEMNLDACFQLSYKDRRWEISSKIKELVPVNARTKAIWQRDLLPVPPLLAREEGNIFSATKRIMVFGQHRYYEHIFIDFLEAKITKSGDIKNPLTSINPLDCVWKSNKNEEIKFYTGLVRFQNSVVRDSSVSDLEALKAIVINPLGIDAYYHDPQVSDNLTAASVVPVALKLLNVDLQLEVEWKDPFYEISGKLEMDGKSWDIYAVKIKYSYFILSHGILYLIDHPQVIRVIEFFRKNNPVILIHQSKFEEFRSTILVDLEKKIKINYSFVKKATPQQIKDVGWDQVLEKKIYLSESEDFVLLTPMVQYGQVEIPILSQQQLYGIDQVGNSFTKERDKELEERFIAVLLRQQVDFKEQIGLDCFYLHKQCFLEEGWFLEAFEQWKENGITIFGFNELKNNRYNANKMKVAVSVSSGLDWFDTSIQLRFGDQNVTLKQLQKSIKNRNKFVELGDGSLGLLPEEWVEKFSNYFRVGELVKDTIRTPKMSFSEVSEMYEKEMLSLEVAEQLGEYRSKFENFESIAPVTVPAALKANLRDYQKEGLNWLNFLDQFGFGGCLADDMGLGKTIQIIAFILLQRERIRHNTNLVVVPTTLIFNWQSEVAKFAPSIKILNCYGADRSKNILDFDGYEIILTSYGTLVSDISFFKDFSFNYIFLDESQAIKNPESQRYKAVRLLKSRNKVVLTGTPIENNTFDLYGQFSFACPGLLGSKQHFKDHYSLPIDKFKETKRAQELQRKINPFLLRRTKTQVAKELPDKTEMVLYCEMGEEQRKIYDSYKQEFRAFLMASSTKKKQMDTLYMLAGLTKLRQICNSPSLLADQEYYGDSSAKLEVLMEEISAKATHHKMIVFSQFVGMLDLIREELKKRNIPFEYLTGQTKDRAEKVDTFQRKKEIRVFLISLKAGGTGLNLTAADYVYLVDPWWNPAVENQAIDRCYRMGQKKNVVAVRLICPNTIEEKIRNLQDSKRELVKDLVRTDDSILKSLSRKELLSLFDA